MRIGIPTEIKPQEGRVALTPEACRQLVEHGHDVCLQTGAGQASGYPDDDYAHAGVRLLDSARQVYDSGDLLVKVKEPQSTETEWLRTGQLLFSYLHLAAEPRLTSQLLACGVTAIGFEIIKVDGDLPLLSPMSQVAGRLAAQVSVELLHSNNGGKGLLLGGLKGTDPGHAVVIGAGKAGMAAVKDLLCTGARVSLLDINLEKLLLIQKEYPSLHIYDSTEPGLLSDIVLSADILIGAALIPGKKAPVLVSREMVRSMPDGGVIVDIAIDQGGCIETSRPCNYENPTYVDEGIVHFCVTNMPGAVPRTATQALSHAILPYVEALADGHLDHDSVLQGAIYLGGGEIQYSGFT
jgi:alanine dehydrogenase